MGLSRATGQTEICTLQDLKKLVYLKLGCSCQAVTVPAITGNHENVLLGKLSGINNEQCSVTRVCSCSVNWVNMMQMSYR